MDYWEWIKVGYDKGFCSDVGCTTHDPPYTLEESESFMDGEDPCCHVVRIYSPMHTPRDE